MVIFRGACPAAPMWKKEEYWSASLLSTAVFMRARRVTRFLLGFFGIEVDCEALEWVIVSGDER
jgi:hypothetical protein